MINKLRLVGSGSSSGRFFYIFDKNSSFFSLFPKFLLECGFRDLGAYEDYLENPPDIHDFVNRIEHFKNEEYDIDVLYTHNRIFLIVRTGEKNKERLINGISSISY